MKSTLLLGVLLATLAAVPAVSALTIINRDPDERQVTIVEQGDEQIFILDSEQALPDVCLSGCSIAPGDGEAVEVDGQGVVAIVDGKIVRED